MELEFESSAAFRGWLKEHHRESAGIWLRLAKKGCDHKTVTYAEALDEALCFGWIDGQKKPLDDSFWLQKFCPRRAKSGWSKINTGHVERLIADGRMTAAGLAEVEAAKADGRWHTAYDSPSKAAPPEDFMVELAKNENAATFFETLNRANIYAIVYRLQTAKKPETREKRMQTILDMLDRGEVFHP